MATARGFDLPASWSRSKSQWWVGNWDVMNIRSEYMQRMGIATAYRRLAILGASVSKAFG